MGVIADADQFLPIAKVSTIYYSKENIRDRNFLTKLTFMVEELSNGNSLSIFCYSSQLFSNIYWHNFSGCSSANYIIYRFLITKKVSFYIALNLPNSTLYIYFFFSNSFLFQTTIFISGKQMQRLHRVLA